MPTTKTKSKSKKKAASKAKVETPMQALRRRLSAIGVKPKFLDEVVLPEWWDDNIAAHPSGFQEAAAHIASRLGFSFTDLVKSTSDLSLPSADVRYKKSKGVDESDIRLTTHFAMSVARLVARSMQDSEPAGDVPEPAEWRAELLEASEKDWVCLRHILRASWTLGIPVVHLSNFPRGAKKADALTTIVDGRPVVVVLNARKAPSWIAFIVAHELGHIHCGHLKSGETLVDEKINPQSTEREEREANDFAVELLTGQTDLGLHSNHKMNGAQLARAVTTFGKKYRVAPGVAALNFGFTANEWALASAAVAILETDDDASQDMRCATADALDADALSEDDWEWLQRTLSIGG